MHLTKLVTAIILLTLVSSFDKLPCIDCITNVNKLQYSQNTLELQIVPAPTPTPNMCYYYDQHGTLTYFPCPEKCYDESGKEVTCEK